MNWGVPDWKDARAYPAPDALTTCEWRWQFTRRRPDYRDLWLKWSPLNEAQILEHKEEYETLAARSGQTIDIFLDSAPTDDHHSVRLKYHMSALRNPAKEFSHWQLMGGSFPPNHAHYPNTHSAMMLARTLIEKFPGYIDDEIELRKRSDELLKAEGVIYYSFDLSQPLEPQFQKARDHLASVQQERNGRQNIRRPRRDNWPLYLRALDARDSEATFAEMAEAFWPDDYAYGVKTLQSARDTYDAACQVRDNFPL